jgi:hypothetical protein
MRFCPFCSAENADELAVCQACGRRLPPLPPRKGRNAPPTGIQLPNRPASPPPPRARPTSPPPLPPSPASGSSSGPLAVPKAGAAVPSAPTAVPKVGAVAASAPTAVPKMTSGPATAPTAAPSFGSGPTSSSFGDSSATIVSSEPPDQTVVSRDPAFEAAQTPAAGSVIAATAASGAPPTIISPPPAPRPVSQITRDSAPALPPPPPVDNDALINAISPGPAATRRQAEPEPRIIADRRGRNDSKHPLSPTAFARSGTASQPPPVGGRANSPSQPPPIGGRANSPSQAPPIGGRANSPSQPPPVPRGPAGRESGPNATQLFAGAPPTPPVGVPKAPDPGGFPPPSAQFDGDEFFTKPAAEPIGGIIAQRETGDFSEPPPTRINRADATDRPFTPPKVLPVPEIPEPGLLNSAKYTYHFAVAHWQRRGAIKQLGVEIKQDTEALDQVLGALGRAARGARIEGKVFSVENAGISGAEERVAQLQKENAEVEGRKAEENSKFVDIERERNDKLAEAEKMVEETQRELTHLEAQRRSLRDKRKELERRQKAYLKSAEDQDRQAGSAPMGDQRQELRRSAEGHRKEAAALEPDRQEIDRRLASLERPFSEATAKLDAAKAELDAAKRSLNDAREGHTHRLAELDAEQKRKSREVALAESEIARRLVTLGTLVNLNRIEDAQFAELYQRIDRLRGAITARTTEIEKLTAEREAYDRNTFWRGVATIGGAFVALIALIVILRAIL